jgi:methylated-DNA-[protein]-cysteine S-methyltransferase
MSSVTRTSVTAATVTTACGPFTVVMRDDAVIASGWTTQVDELMEPVSSSSRPSAITVRSDLGSVTRAVTRYFEGDFLAIDDVEVEQHSGPFIEEAWGVLRTIPAGSPVTYAELAAKLGRPEAVRAAANACAYNCAALFVPCHRVVRTGAGPYERRLGGFRWGLPVKRSLLDHESGRSALTSL